jgi:hypothetical protein
VKALLATAAALASDFCWRVPTPIEAICWHLDNRPDAWTVQKLPKGYWADHASGWALSVYEKGHEPAFIFGTRPTYRVVYWRGGNTPTEYEGKQARMIAKRVARLCKAP